MTGVHRLRHTLRSHLAMRGMPAQAIQELAGHQNLTMRSGTCTRVARRSKARFDCWIFRKRDVTVEKYWEREEAKILSRYVRSGGCGPPGDRTRDTVIK